MTEAYWPTYKVLNDRSKRSLLLKDNLKESHDNIKGINFQSHVGKFDQRKYSTVSYCYIGLGGGCSTKEAIDCFIRRAPQRKT